MFLDGKVAFLDFGCVKHFEAGFITGWKAYIRAILEGDRLRADQLSIKMGFAPKPQQFDFAHHYRMMRKLYEPWLTDSEYKITKDLVQIIWRGFVTENPNKYCSNLPKDWVFTNRLQWGLFSVLAEMGAEFNAREIILGLIYKPGEARPEVPH